LSNATTKLGATEYGEQKRSILADLARPLQRYTTTEAMKSFENVKFLFFMQLMIHTLLFWVMTLCSPVSG